MNGFILRMLISMLGLFLASAVVPGVTVSGVGTFILAALLLGIVNAFVRPIALIVTLPITLLTLGLFLLVVNAAMVGLVAAMLDNFAISGFWAALFGSLVISITSAVASWYIGPDGRIQLLALRK